MIERVQELEPVSRTGKPVGIKLLIAVQLGLVLLAVPSGLMLLLDPSGSLIGGQFILPSLTGSLPFIHDFTPVGLWLIAVYGAIPLVMIFGIWIRSRTAWLLTLVLGVTVIGWILVELSLFYALGFTPMYPLVGGLGVATVALSLAPSVRAHFGSSHASRGY